MILCIISFIAGGCCGYVLACLVMMGGDDDGQEW